MRYLIDFSYSGDLFNGYQKQPGCRTIQVEIEKVLTNINNSKVIIYAAGRTDAKVNALHQMAHFDLNKNIDSYKLRGALNSYLPSDIYINEVKQVSDNFHARYMVKSKTYEYKINTGVYNPILRTHVYQYCKPFNINKLRESLSYFEGTHDFTTFTCAEDKRTDKVRTIFETSVSKENEIITISFSGNGFLKYQIRNMIGLLIGINECKNEPSDIPKLFDKKNRNSNFLCAPACGLTLVNVNYK